MIEHNFSNYSAWHNRSVLLCNLMKKKSQGFFPKEKVLNDEYEHVHDAIFTDPDDQSGWFYYLWLLDQTVKTDAPLLVTSWPAHESNVILSRNRRSDDSSFSPFDSFHSDSGTIPLILYFNQAVEGVNSSTITIESSFCTKDLNWKPLLQNNSQLSQVWVTHIKFPDAKPHSSEAYKLKIRVGQSQGIISASGIHYSHPTQFAFKVCLHPFETEPATKQGGLIILWRDENFHVYQPQSQEVDEVVPIDQLITNDHEPTASNWRAETIDNEIALFRELSELNGQIGKLTLARLLTAHDVILSPRTSKMAHSEEILELYTDLIKLDPLHSQYYKDEHSLVLLQKVTSNRGSLLNHCFSYKNLASSSIGNDICLRLSNLSLSRMGSIEKLLWVQMLDLSHNELRSIEDKSDVSLIRLNGKNYSAWAFHFRIFVKGKELWGHVDGSNPAPDKNKDKDQHAKWEVKDAQVMAWILGSVEPNIILNLRSSQTAAQMWTYLKKIYSQQNTARWFQLEHELATLQQDSLSVSDFYSRFTNLWAEYTDIVYAGLPSEGLSSVQSVHETTQRDQFLMKLRPEFEGTRSNLMNRESVPNLDTCLNDLLREEQHLLTQTTMEQRRSTSVPVAYVAQGKPRGRDMSTVQCFCCKGFGHYAANCPRKFCNYCKKDGHIIKECPTRPPKKSETAYTVSVGSSGAGSFVNTAPLTQSAPAPAPVQPVTPDMIQQMIISAFSALGLSGSTVRADDREGA